MPENPYKSPEAEGRKSVVPQRAGTLGRLVMVPLLCGAIAFGSEAGSSAIRIIFEEDPRGRHLIGFIAKSTYALSLAIVALGIYVRRNSIVLLGVSLAVLFTLYNLIFHVW
jgi:hypothetical protein